MESTARAKSNPLAYWHKPVLPVTVPAVIDLHCHLLPGIDDGPSTVEEAIGQARAHLDVGVRTVVCTPHVSQRYPNSAARIASAVEQLRAALDDAGVPLEILPGAEVALSRAVELSDEELRALHLAGSDLLLLEPPLGTDVPRLPAIVANLQARGHKILLAHPERCAAFHRDPSLLAELCSKGALAQVTAASLGGAFGRTVQRVAADMVTDKCVQVIASDAHGTHGRVPGLKAALERGGYEALIPWACDAAPRALLAGEEPPPRPELPKKKRGLFGRR